MVRRYTPEDRLNGKVAIVTGGSSGIGKVTVKRFAELGAHVFVLSRNKAKTIPVLENIKAETGNDKIELIEVDFSSLQEVKNAAEEFLSRNLPLHILACNAGSAANHGATADGFEFSFGTNYLSHFLLTQLLLNKLKQSAPSRIVNVSSIASLLSHSIDYDAVLKPSPAGVNMDYYGVSKLAQVLSTNNDYRSLHQFVDSNLPVANIVRHFIGRLDFNEDQTVELPSFVNLKHLNLCFRSPIPEFTGCMIYRQEPKSYNLPISALNSILTKYHELTSLRLNGVIFREEMMKSLAMLIGHTKLLELLEISFNGEIEEAFVVSKETLGVFEKNLSGLLCLKSFSHVKSRGLNRKDYAYCVISGLESVRTLSELSLTKSFIDQLEFSSRLTRLLSLSKISTLELKHVSVTEEMAEVIKGMSSLSQLILRSNECSNSLFALNLPPKRVVQRFVLEQTSVPMLDNECIDSRNIESLLIENLFLHRSTVSFIDTLIASLRYSIALREFKCRIDDEKNFSAVVEIIRTCSSLKLIAITNRTYNIGLFGGACTLIHQDWFGDMREKFYDALEGSSIRVLEISNRLVEDKRLQHWMESSATIEKIVITAADAAVSITDCVPFCHTVKRNIRRRFGSLVINIRDDVEYGVPFERIRIYQHKNLLKIKLFSISESNEKLKDYFATVVVKCLESWESDDYCVNSIVLDELCDLDCEFLKSKFQTSTVHFGFKNGEYCFFQQ
ncbi:hypothetical protein HK098_006740 [Nowakowskiella sp. JEL0407]|nr:hypothetical protein HK098_006740 [Nowakowskiella sp. JEL0407]